MPIQVNDQLQNNSPKPLDRWYHKGFIGGVSIPYTSVDDANATIPSDFRSVGLKVLITVNGANREFWYRGGVLDTDLVERDITITSGNNITVSQVGNIVTISANNVTSGDTGTTESFVVTGDFSKSFSAGTILTSFIIDPPDNNSYIISVGTTEGGNDIFDSYNVDGTKPKPFLYAEYFKTGAIWYFTGIPSGTRVIMMYQPPILLV